MLLTVVYSWHIYCLQVQSGLAYYMWHTYYKCEKPIKNVTQILLIYDAVQHWISSQYTALFLATYLCCWYFVWKSFSWGFKRGLILFSANNFSEIFKFSSLLSFTLINSLTCLNHLTYYVCIQKSQSVNIYTNSGENKHTSRISPRKLVWKKQFLNVDCSFIIKNITVWNTTSMFLN